MLRAPVKSQAAWFFFENFPAIKQLPRCRFTKQTTDAAAEAIATPRIEVDTEGIFLKQPKIKTSRREVGSGYGDVLSLVLSEDFLVKLSENTNSGYITPVILCV